MSYSILIGAGKPDEEKLRGYLKDGDNHLAIDFHVEGTSHPDAPVFPNDAMTGNGNGRHPSYSGWTQTLEQTGLRDLFFNNETGLMRKHPGCFLIRKADAAEVRKALRLWKKTHPENVPGFPADALLSKPEPVPKNVDPILARLIWLEFWMTWALGNCSTPAIYNY